LPRRAAFGGGRHLGVAARVLLIVVIELVLRLYSGEALVLAGVNKTMDWEPYDRKGILVRVFCVGASPFHASMVLKWTNLFPS